MTYTGVTRDGYRRAVTTLTGVVAIGALTATGWLSGEAANSYAAQQHDQAAAKAAWEAKRQALLAARAAWFREQAARTAAAHPVVRTVWKKRRTETVVDTRVVPYAAVGTGGQLSSSAPSTSYAGTSSSGSSASSGSSGSSSSSGSHASSGSAAAPPAAPPPPPPPPPPVTTSGS